MANSTDLNNLTLHTVVTDADLLALCEHLLVHENGEAWAKWEFGDEEFIDRAIQVATAMPSVVAARFAVGVGAATVFGHHPQLDPILSRVLPIVPTHVLMSAQPPPSKR